jgi:hedgehog protein
VTLASGERRRLRDLAVGDAPLAVDAAGALVHSAAYVFPHFVTTGLFAFKRLSTAAGANVTATGGHYMLVGRGPGAGAWARRAAVPARDVRIGDVLWVVSGADAGAALAPSPVVGVADVMAEGIVNPLTLAGTLVVDGVAASVYVDMLGSEARMHALCGAWRAMWRLAPWALKALHRAGWAPPAAMGLGRATRAVLVAAGSIAA